MSPTVSITGEGISIEREISEDTAPRLIETAMGSGAPNEGAVTVTLSGEGMSFEREVTEQVATDTIEIAIQNGSPEGQDVSEDNEDEAEPHDYDGLPDDFFSRLTSKQEALIKVLMEGDGWMLNGEIRQKMEDEYEESVDRGPAMAGILAGLSRKYGTNFRRDLINGSWAGDEVKLRLNRDYEEELREGLDL